MKLFHKIGKFLYDNINNASDVNIVILYFAITTIARSAFWFQAVIDWDESTYILMGQTLLDGKLLYQDLWGGLKPPLAYASYALFITLFGKSIVAVRIGGALCVFISAALTYFVSRQIFDRVSAVLAGAVFILAASFLHNGQATYTEHIALVPLLGGVVILQRSQLSRSHLLALGAMLAAAALVRFNLAVLAVIVGGIVIFHPGHRCRSARVKAGAVYASSGLAVVALASLPYLISGNLDLWWSSQVIAPLARAEDGHSPLVASLRLGAKYFNLGSPVFLFSSLFILTSLVSMFLAMFNIKQEEASRRRSLIILFIMTAGTGVTTLFGGAYGHYLIQITPFLSIFTGIMVTKSLCSRFLFPISLIYFVAVALAFRPAYWEYRYLAARVAAGESLNYGSAYEIAAYVDSLQLDEFTIFMMSDHIVYWFLDKPPPTRIAHPSTIFRPNLLKAVNGPDAEPTTEIAAIFDQAPTIVVKREDERYLRRFPAERQYIKQRLENYDLVHVVKADRHDKGGNLQIFLIMNPSTNEAIVPDR